MARIAQGVGWAAWLLCAATGAGACKGSPPPPTATVEVKADPAAAAVAREPGSFVDVTEASGIDFRHHPLPGTRFGDPIGFSMNHYVHGSGLACGDADGDGRVDLYLMDQDGPNALYRNLGGMRFEDVTVGSGTALSDRVSTAAAFADLDGDGDQDLLVAGIRSGVAALRNDGAGHFEDASGPSGLAERKGHITAIGLIDGDGDGLVDVFAGHNAIFTEERRGPNGHPLGMAASMGHYVGAEASHYYRNLGGLTFEPADEASGMVFRDWPTGSPKMDPSWMFWAGDVVVADFEPDGRPDLIVGNMAGHDRFFRNLGGGRFEDATKRLLDRGVYGSFGIALLDADGDGRQDLAVADMHSDMFIQPHDVLTSIDWRAKHRKLPLADTASIRKKLKLWKQTIGRLKATGDAERLPKAAAEVKKMEAMLRTGQSMIFGNALLRNTGDRPWPDGSDVAGIENLMPWGVISADFDMDGHEDLFFPAGMGWPWDWSPDFYYRNRGGGRFDEVTEAVGLLPKPEERYFGAPLKTIARSRSGKFVGKPGSRRAVASRAVVACDLDDDGDQDLVIARWDAPTQIFENRLPPKGSTALVLRLRGKAPGTDAIGARVEVKVGKRVLLRTVPGTAGYLAGPERRLFFGLPGGAKPDSVTVHWPYGAAQIVDPASLVTGGAPNVVRQAP